MSKLSNISWNRQPQFNLNNRLHSCSARVVFTHISVAVGFLPSWHNFGDIKLNLCVFCQLPSANKSPNFKSVS